MTKSTGIAVVIHLPFDVCHARFYNYMPNNSMKHAIELS